jgi:hypothetical protein
MGGHSSRNGKEKFTSSLGKPEHCGRRVPACVTDQYNRETVNGLRAGQLFQLLVLIEGQITGRKRMIKENGFSKGQRL